MNDWLKTISDSSKTRELPCDLKKENVTAIADEPTGVVSSAKVTRLIPSCPTVRAGEGLACKLKPVAALVLKVCPSYSADFKDSSCAKNARAVLGKTNPDDVIKADPKLQEAAQAKG